ncbi:MAG: helix-turn-helix domain-containing protein, partial [Candidatus Omnitrophica bacterium]|nr:helix-turn-helix domain-containing protein [Candidatus Omnitrophota bacterium]
MVKMLNPEQVSDMLKIKVSTIYQWTHQRFIPHIKVGRFVRFR